MILATLNSSDAHALVEYVGTTIEMPRQVMESYPEPHQKVNYMKVA